MNLEGAGGTSGGIGRFFIGLVMFIGGAYLFFNAIHVTNSFGMGSVLYNLGGINLTGGLVLIPFIFGIGMVFYNSKNPIGWILITITLVLLTFGVISNIHFRMRRMTAFELMMILGLFIGGLGLFLSSLKNLEK